ncbi:Phenazine biosynthesis protein, PhzF family [Sulfitobacter noctilucicola]|uniref:PhzF family phenazine biosynthesis protein n=1 Tax=Sulfitobacter noctilucicola TaxID=1342301 RepID=A0A7W6M6U7_9RHOB|nr:PhzF family phenazine biosynthesis isomerase [Sulfitobacter noctilucicola]KIN62023.1 Phenazine biosynthesis protein, PhzF family [Sulfitobacter noctilucicola]MBB4173459.1 PhzF family phenazine biosynthesis protein [Sulfitobacter noctilucicola]
MEFAFDWVDAFADAPFGGNGCAVVHGGAALSDDTCMAYVRETSLVECTFTGPSEIADLKVKYYLASREIPFAGHPTIATVAALVHRGMVSGTNLSLETGAGIVDVQIEGDLITMTQVEPEFGAEVPASVVAQVGAISPDDIIAQPQIVSTGLPFCITVLRDISVVEKLRFDTAGFAAYCAHLGLERDDLMEPYWVTLQGATATGDTFSRLLLAPPSPAEDAFTGSATGAAAAYLWSRGLLGKRGYVAEQGHGMGRPGQARVEVLGPPDGITGVKVAGRGIVVMSGTAFLPE